MKVWPVIAAAIVGGVTGWVTAADKPFDREIWASADYSSGKRNQMVDEILRTRMLIGKSRTEVVALLGEPPATDYFSEWDLVYVLGPERELMSIDSEWLVLRLKDNHVDEARLVRD